MEANRCCLFRGLFFQTRHKTLLKDKMLPICLKNTPREQSKEIQGRYALGSVVSNVLTAISAGPSHFLEQGMWMVLSSVRSLQAQQRLVT